MDYPFGPFLPGNTGRPTSGFTGNSSPEYHLAGHLFSTTPTHRRVGFPGERVTCISRAWLRLLPLRIRMTTPQKVRAGLENTSTMMERATWGRCTRSRGHVFFEQCGWKTMLGQQVISVQLSRCGLPAGCTPSQSVRTHESGHAPGVGRAFIEDNFKKSDKEVIDGKHIGTLGRCIVPFELDFAGLLPDCKINAT